MDLTFTGKANELDENFLSAIKTMYGDKNVRVNVEEEMDTTEYLLSNPANAKHLLDAIEKIDNGTAKLIEVDIENFARERGIDL
ncbi:MAG: hypothetical protein SFY32_10245 [Bacteroidota bacterium]|nr:hypothetical protein [Bacteroidota bacterium]